MKKFKMSVLSCFILINSLVFLTYCENAGEATAAAETESSTDSGGNDSGGTVEPPDTTAPSSPQSFSSSVLSDSEIRLTWQAASDNKSSASQISYEICYNLSNSGCDTFTVNETVTAGTLTKDLTGLSGNTTYYIKIRAKDAAGNTSNPVTTSAQTQVSGSVGGIQFSISAGEYNSDQSLSLSTSTSSATICYRSDGTDPSCTEGTCGSGSTTYSSTINVNSNQTIKALGCRAGYVNSNVNSTSYIVDKTAPTAPTNFQSTSKNQTSISLSWTASTDSGGASSFKYEICHGTSDGCSSSFSSTIGNIANTTQTISSLTADTNYYIYLRAVDSAGNNSSVVAVQSNPIRTDALWSGVKLFGSSSVDSAEGIDIDSQGNIYVSGRVKGSIDSQSYRGGYDIFLTKFNSSGEKQWTRQLGSGHDDWANDLTIDNEDNIIITGYTSGTLGDQSSNYTDVFVTKYNGSGERQWITLLGNSSGERGFSVVTDSSNNIFVTGHGKGDLGSYSNANSGYEDIIIAKFSSAGVQQWAKLFNPDGSGRDYSYSIALDSSGNIIIAGKTASNLDGNTGSGSNDAFIVKFDSAGNRLWSKLKGSSNSDYWNGLTIDQSNNIYVTGIKDKNCYLGKYSSSGSEVWFEEIIPSGGNTVQCQGIDVVSDKSSSIYITGWTGGNLDGITRAGGKDIVIAKYSSSGTKQWIKLLGTTSDDEGRSIILDSNNNPFIAGYSKGDLNGETNTGVSGDIFIAKYNSSGDLQ